jgi:flagellar FliL protein
MSAAATAPEAAPSKMKKLIPIIGAAVVSAAIAGGAVFFLMPKEKPAKHAVAEGDEAAAEGEGEEAAAEGEHEGGGEDEGEGAKKSAGIYVPMTPAFVVNIGNSDASNFLQIEMQVRARNAAAVDALKQHDPQIRNALLMLLGSQQLADITTREGKEGLQKKVLEEIQRILKAETGKAGVDAVYFTSFVMQ